MILHYKSVTKSLSGFYFEGSSEPEHVPSADGHPALHPRHDRPCPDVPKRLPCLLFPPPFPRPVGVRGALRAPRGAQLRPLASLRPQHLAVRRHRLLRGALPQGEDAGFAVKFF